MNLDFDANELRVLGCLIEKELTTPDQYPLSTNALINACNQKTSRDPVMDLSEREVDAAMLALRERGLARSSKPSGSRAWKHRHVLTEVLPISPGEIAVLTVLMLRGAQAPGELKTRTDRMHGFDDLEAVEGVLQGLAARSQPLVRNIGRESGQSQDRWEHLLSSDQPAVRPPLAIAFHELHDHGIFTMPNPWDAGSAVLLQELGFPALATTSSGLGRSIGKDDQEVTRDELVAHVAALSPDIDVSAESPQTPQDVVVSFPPKSTGQQIDLDLQTDTDGPGSPEPQETPSSPDPEPAPAPAAVNGDDGISPAPLFGGIASKAWQTTDFDAEALRQIAPIARDLRAWLSRVEGQKAG